LTPLLRALSLLVVLTLTLPGSALAAPAAAEVHPATFTDASTADAVSFHPYLTTDTASSSYQGLVYAGGLMRRNPDTLALEPDMAREMPAISEDGRTFTFRLRDDLKWSDGTPLTADDFKWTYDKAMDPANGFPYREQFSFIESYEAPDPLTIRVTVKERFAPALEGVDFVTPLPRHIWANLDWSDPEKNPEIMHPSVASGPFKLKEWVRDQYAIFEANETYHRGKPKIDTYVVRIVPDQTVAFELLKKGEVDTADVGFADYQALKQLDNVNVYEWWPAAGNWSYVGFNLRKPALQDVHLRHALAYAVDRQALIDGVMQGLAQPLYSAYPSTSWAYNPDVPRYDFNLEQAKQELQAAGYEIGSDGLARKDGQPLTLRLLFGPNTSRERERIATILQNNWRQIGVQVEIQGLEWATFLDTIQKPPFDWDLVIGGWASTLDPHWMVQIWSQQGIPELNMVNYVNPQIEDLFKQGAIPFDQAERKPYYDQIQRILAEDSPYIFLFFSKTFTGVNKRVVVNEPKRLGIAYDIQEWYIQAP